MGSAAGNNTRLSTTCQSLVTSSQAAEEAVLEFVRYYPAGRQDVSSLSRELGEVRTAASLLQRNDEEPGQRSTSAAPNVRPSVVAVAHAALSLVDQIGESLRQPDRSRENWLQDVADSLSGMTRRAELFRMTLNVGLDALLSANVEPAPNPSDLPPYQTTQIVQEVLAIRTRISEVNDSDDSQAQAEVPALVELLDCIQAFVEQTSSLLSIPPAGGDGASSAPSGRSDVASVRSDGPPPPPPPVFELVQITHPAPEQIGLRHVSKIEIGMSEILQIKFFQRRSQLAVAVSSLYSPIKTVDIKGTTVPVANQVWGTHMAFCAEAPVWAYVGDGERESTGSIPEYRYRDDLNIKRPITIMSNHSTGVKMQSLLGTFAKPLAFSKFGTHFALARPGGRLAIMHATGVGNQSERIVSCFHTDDVTHAVFTPDSAGLVSISRDGTIRMIDANTGESLAKLDVDTWKQPQFLGIAPDGNVIVSIWGDTVYRWDYNTGSLDTYVLGTRRRRDGRPIAISADCRFLACSTHDGVDVGDLHTGRLIHSIRFQGGFVTAAEFSSDGRYLALGKAVGGVLRVTKATVDIWELVF